MKTQFLSVACGMALLFNSADAQRMAGGRQRGSRENRGNRGNRDNFMDALAERGNNNFGLMDRAALAASMGASEFGVQARQFVRGRGGGRGKLALETLETCADVIDFDCALNFGVAEVIDELEDMRDAREQGLEVEVSDDLKLQMEEIRQCLRTVVPMLAEDDECRLAMPSHSQGGGNRRRRGFDKLEACAADIDQNCDLDFEAGTLADELAALKAAKEEGLEVDEELKEEVKAKAKEAMMCLKEIMPTLDADGECRSS